MRATILRLYEAQRDLLLLDPKSAKRRLLLNALQASVPAPVLAHFLRLVVNGGRGVAIVRHGVCSECHIRLPSSLVAELVQPDEDPVCAYCGRFLLLPEEELPAPPAPVVLNLRRRGRRCRRPLAA